MNTNTQQIIDKVVVMLAVGEKANDQQIIDKIIDICRNAGNDDERLKRVMAYMNRHVYQIKDTIVNGYLVGFCQIIFNDYLDKRHYLAGIRVFMESVTTCEFTVSCK